MKEKHSIIPILEHYGTEGLYERQGWQKIKCPFHGDSHASAAVNTEQNVFKCFACSISGDTYNLIMQKEGIGFREAYIRAETITGVSDPALPSVSESGRRISNKQGTNTPRRGYTPPRGRRKSSTWT